jgi:guanine deaminase
VHGLHRPIARDVENRGETADVEARIISGRIESLQRSAVTTPSEPLLRSSGYPVGMNTDASTSDSHHDSGSGAEDTEFLRQAVALAVENVPAGGGPFGAVIVREDAVIGAGQNRVTRDNDPSAHAEIVAIREAGQALGDHSLEGATLYTSCEPCPMCMAAALWARVDRVVYAADRHDAADGGFDDLAFYRLFETDRSEWDVPVEAIPLKEATVPFERWLNTEGRTEY